MAPEMGVPVSGAAQQIFDSRHSIFQKGPTPKEFVFATVPGLQVGMVRGPKSGPPGPETQRKPCFRSQIWVPAFKTDPGRGLDPAPRTMHKVAPEQGSNGEGKKKGGGRRASRTSGPGQAEEGRRGGL